METVHWHDIEEIFGFDTESFNRAEKEIPEIFGKDWDSGRQYDDLGNYYAAISRYLKTGTIYR